MLSEVSFTQKIKEELSTNEYDNDEAIKSLLCGFTATNGRMLLENKETIIALSTEHAKIAKLIYSLYSKRYGINPRLAYTRKMKFDKKVCFNILIDMKADEILEDLEIDLWSNNYTKSFLRKEENIKHYLLGVFLASGSCNDPISSNYHMEMALNHEEHAVYVNKLMNRPNPIAFDSKIIKRRNQYVVYLKKSDQIVDFLAYIGAHNACLDFEEVRVERDFRNNDNRLQICENANVYRTVSSAKRQINDIQIIDKTVGISNIPNPKIKILCLLRLENEELSMAELASLLSYEIGSPVSKSNVNHLFRAIHEMAERYRGEN